MLNINDRYWIHLNGRHVPDFEYKFPVIRRLLPKNSKLNIFDFGCGMGEYISYLKQENPESTIFASDVSNICIKYVRKRFPYVHSYKNGESKPIPIQSGLIDYCLALDVLEHTYDTEFVLHELARIVKKRGKLLISVPYYGLLKNIIISVIAFDEVFNPLGPHVRFFTKKSLVNCIKNVGFEPIKVGYFGRFFPFSRGMFMLAIKIRNEQT